MRRAIRTALHFLLPAPPTHRSSRLPSKAALIHGTWLSNYTPTGICIFAIVYSFILPFLSFSLLPFLFFHKYLLIVYVLDTPRCWAQRNVQNRYGSWSLPPRSLLLKIHTDHINTLIITGSQVVLGKDKRHTRKNHFHAGQRRIHLVVWAKPFCGNVN